MEWHAIAILSPSWRPLCNSRHTHPSIRLNNVISTSLSINLLRIKHLWCLFQEFTCATDPRSNIEVTCFRFAKALTRNHGLWPDKRPSLSGLPILFRYRRKMGSFPRNVAVLHSAPPRYFSKTRIWSGNYLDHRSELAPAR